MGDSIRRQIPGIRDTIDAAAAARNWRTSRIAPLKKPGKDKHYCVAYRPASLTSAIAKAVEKLVMVLILKHTILQLVLAP